MKKTEISRRNFFKAGVSVSAALALSDPQALLGAASYPDRDITLILTSKAGGSLDRAIRAFSPVWKEHLGTGFKYDYYRGAGGEVGLTVVSRRPPDGYSVGASLISSDVFISSVRKTDFKLKDFVYFAQIRNDPNGIIVHKDSPYKSLKDLVKASKKKPLPISVSRLPHVSTLGLLMIQEATGAQFNITPYGGGNSSRAAVIKGEVEAAASPLGAAVSLKPEIRVISIFQPENLWPEMSDNAPTVKEELNIDLPALSSDNGLFVLKKFKDKNPEGFQKLSESAQKTANDPRFIEAVMKGAGFPRDVIMYSGEAEVAERIKKVSILIGKHKGFFTGKKK